MKMKFIVFFMAITFTVGMACTAKANLILLDWDFYEDGETVSGSIVTTRFEFVGSGAGFGTLEHTVTGTGKHDVAAWFDYVDGDLGDGTPNDTATKAGALGYGQSWDAANASFGLIQYAAQTGQLTNRISLVDNGDDVSFAMGWEFTLGVDDIAIITYTLSAAAPGGFYIQHLNGATTGDDVFLSSTLSKWHYTGTVFDDPPSSPIDTAPIPEPATIALLGIGLVGLAGAEVRRRRKKKVTDNS